MTAIMVLVLVLILFSSVGAKEFGEQNHILFSSAEPFDFGGVNESSELTVTAVRAWCAERWGENFGVAAERCVADIFSEQQNTVTQPILKLPLLGQVFSNKLDNVVVLLTNQTEGAKKRSFEFFLSRRLTGNIGREYETRCIFPKIIF